MDNNYYEILGVPQDASFSDIKKAYQKLAGRWHPDKNKDNEEHATTMFQQISAAYQILKNPELRKDYDDFLAREAYQEEAAQSEREYDFSSEENAESTYQYEDSSSEKSTGTNTDSKSWTEADWANFSSHFAQHQHHSDQDMYWDVMFDLASELITTGTSEEEIVLYLVEAGCPIETAKLISRAVRADAERARKSSAKKEEKDRQPEPEPDPEPETGLNQRDKYYYETIIGKKNTNFYLSKFDRFKSGGSTVSWNWPCFILTPAWLAYRKMWGFLFIYFIYVIVFSIVDTVVFELSENEKYFDLLDFFPTMVHVFLAMYANYLYFTYCATHVEKYKHKAHIVNNNTGYLKKMGGTSPLAAIIVGLIFCFYILFYIVFSEEFEQELISNLPSQPNQAELSVPPKGSDVNTSKLSNDRLIEIGLAYYNGDQVSEDKAEAFRWFYRAAQRKDMRGELHVGFMYQDGDGIAQNIELAKMYLSRAAAQGNGFAFVRLGEMYYLDGYFPINDKLALQYFKQALGKSNGFAEFYIAVIYDNGYGVNVNKKMALKFYKDALAQGDSSARLEIERLEKELRSVGASSKAPASPPSVSKPQASQPASSPTQQDRTPSQAKQSENDKQEPGCVFKPVMTQTDLDRCNIASATQSLDSSLERVIVETDNRVVLVQQKLRELGYYTAEITGVNDKYTRQVLEQFQLNRRIPITGEPDFNTQRALRIRQ